MGLVGLGLGSESADPFIFPTCWGGSSLPGSVPPNDTVRSNSMMGIKLGESGMVTRYQVDEFAHTWPVDHFVAQSPIYPGFMGKVSTLMHFLLEAGV